MSIIDSSGVNLSTLTELTIDNTNRFKEKTGTIDVSTSSAAGELIAILSEMQLRNEQLVADAFSQNTIGSATGQNLDNIAKIKNQTRIQNSKSVAYIEITGTEATYIPLGTEFTCASNSELFFTEYEVTIPASGVIFVSAASQNDSVSCLANDLSLTTAITGVTTATNLTPAVIGTEQESDESLRTRLQTIGTTQTVNLKEGLYLALSEVPNVTKVKILDNNTDAAIEGVPARYFSPVVLGGNNAAIADVIFKYMGVGNPSFGDIKQLTRSLVTGDTYEVEFNRPTQLLTVVDVTISVDIGFNNTTGVDQIKSNIINYFDTLGIGENLITQKIEAVCFITGVETVSLTTNGTTANKTAAFKEMFVTNDANVTVTIA